MNIYLFLCIFICYKIKYEQHTQYDSLKFVILFRKPPEQMEVQYDGLSYEGEQEIDREFHEVEQGSQRKRRQVYYDR